MHPPDPVKLRDALPSDLPFLLALYASTRADEFAHLGWPVDMERAFMKMQFEMQRNDYEQRHPGARCEIIEMRRCPIGRLWVAQDARALTVLDISLVAELRGQGIGSDCLRRVQRWAQATGLGVELQVVVGNPAQRLYERLGFRNLGAGEVRQSMAWHPDMAADTSSTANSFEEIHHEQA